MERNVKNSSVGLGLVGVLLLVAFIPIPAYAAEVWSDDFDDENYDGWTVTEGEFTCADGYLEVTEHDVGWNAWSGIYHNSTVTSGTWSFDYFRVTGRLSVNLMTDKHKLTLGYNLFIYLRVTHIEIVRYTQGDEGHGATLASLEILEAYECWTHIDVTIDESWNI